MKLFIRLLCHWTVYSDRSYISMSIGGWYPRPSYKADHLGSQCMYEGAVCKDGEFSHLNLLNPTPGRKCCIVIELPRLDIAAEERSFANGSCCKASLCYL